MKIPRLIPAALVAALAIASTALNAAPPGDAPSAAPGDSDRQCLACHAEAGLSMALANGESLALHVDAGAFARSVHASVGCSACHADVDLKKHPGDVRPARSARDLSVAMVQACQGCHDDSYRAHAASVHGRAQARGDAAAPLCTTCHGTHDIVRASSSGPALREACLGCHADAPAAHDKWLPNTKLHLQVVSCAACHAPTAGKRVELRFYDVAAAREAVTDAVPATNGRGANGATKTVDAAGLRELVRTIDREGKAGNVVLMGRVEPVAGAEGHRLLAKAQALKDCATCHRKGADPFKKVSLSVVGPDGERVLYEAQQDVLHAPTSIESVRAFYAMGGTRIHFLDVVLALALAGGILAPLGHLVVRKLMRRKDERNHG